MILELGRRGYNVDALLEGAPLTGKVLSDNLDGVNTFDQLGSLVAKNATEWPQRHRIDNKMSETGEHHAYRTTSQSF